MKVIRFIGAATTAAALSLAITGAASAADVNMTTTGPDSVNKVETNNQTTITTTNTSVVSVSNENVQFSKTGDVTAKDNTVVGGLGNGEGLVSGDATNSSATTTTVSVNNPAVGGLGDEAGVTPGGSGSMVGGANGSTPAAGGQGGAVLGAATTGGKGGGAAILPVTGPSGFVDVSALRAAWHPQSAAPATVLAKKAEAVTTLMLVMATVLSLLGALGTALYNRRKEGRL